MSSSNGHAYGYQSHPVYNGNGASSGYGGRRGRGLSDLALNEMLLSRAMMARQMTDSRRDIFDECGFPKSPSAEDYKLLYDRDSVAARVVEVMAKECWQVQPSVYEDEDPKVTTPFEEAWDALGRSLHGEKGLYADERGNPIWEYLLRVDILSGIGRYGVIVLGLDDGKRLDQPVDGVEEAYSVPLKKGEQSSSGSGGGIAAQYGVYNLTVNAAKTKGRKLRYIRVFPESLAEVVQWEGNDSSPRYGAPVMYSVTHNDPRDDTGGIGAPIGTKQVHWTRVIHIADRHHQASSHEYLAVPRLRPVLNDVLSAQKVAAADGEGFWKNGRSIVGWTAREGYDAGNISGLKDMVERMRNGLQNDVFLENMDAAPIQVTLADPTPHQAIHIERICIKLSMPVPVFKGYEIGEQASTNNDADWADRVKEAQYSYRTPCIIVPLVDRLVLVGVLPEPSEYHVFWPDVTSMSASQKADIFAKRMTAFGAYVSGGVNTLIPPKEMMVHEAGFEDDEAEAILEAAEQEQEDELDRQVMEQSRMIDEGLQPDPVVESEAKVEALKAGAAAKGTGAGFPPKKPVPVGNEELENEWNYEDEEPLTNASRAKLSGGRWVTLDNGSRVYIKGGKAVAGNPHAVKAANSPGGERKSGPPDESKSKPEKVVKKEPEKKVVKEEPDKSARTKDTGTPTKASGGKASVGTHIKKLAGDTAEGEALLTHLDAADATHGGKLNEFLARHPIKTVNVGRTDSSNTSGGLYNAGTGKLSVKPSSKMSDGTIYDADDQVSVRHAQKAGEGKPGQLKNQEVTFIHEVGHHVLLTSIAKHPTGNKTVYKDAVIDAFMEDSKKTSKYADSSPHEYFAESFAAYHYDPKSLSPTAKKMVETVMSLSEKL